MSTLQYCPTFNGKTGLFSHMFMELGWCDSGSCIGPISKFVHAINRDFQKQMEACIGKQNVFVLFLFFIIFALIIRLRVHVRTASGAPYKV